MPTIRVLNSLFSKQVNRAFVQLSVAYSLFSDLNTDLINFMAYLRTLPDGQCTLHYLRIVSSVAVIF